MNIHEFPSLLLILHFIRTSTKMHFSKYLFRLFSICFNSSASFDRYGEIDRLLALTLRINPGEAMGFQGITAHHKNPLSK